MDISAIEAVLRDMRNQFVDEIPERCQRMEELATQVMEQGIPGDAFDELYRHIHSLKGSGGTHGLPIITSICHRFENLLTDLGDRRMKITPAVVAQLVAYVDLLASTADAIRQGHSVVDKELELERMLEPQGQRQRVALVAESSKAMQGLFRSALEGLGVKVIMVDTGMQALIRLVHEPIDLLLLGNELNELNGQAVVAALRESHCRNHGIPVVLVKSVNSPLSEHIKVTTVVTRDARMADRLPVVLKKILERA